MNKTHTLKKINLSRTERNDRIKNSLVFCRKTGCYITHGEYMEFLESLIAY